MVGSQIATLTLNLSFGHNLCIKYSNGSCELILNIYDLKALQWYKELFNLMSFDLCNCLLKIQKSIVTPTPKMRTHLGVCEFIPSHSFTLPGAWNVTPRFHSWLAPLQALTLGSKMLIHYNWDSGNKMLLHQNQNLGNKMLLHQNWNLGNKMLFHHNQKWMNQTIYVAWSW